MARVPIAIVQCAAQPSGLAQQMADDDDTLVLSSGGRRLEITPRMLEALGEVLHLQIACEDAEAADARPVLRPVRSDGTIAHPIACQARINAGLDSRPTPDCTWAPDGDDFECQLCAERIAVGDDRHHTLARLFGSGSISDRERLLISAVLRRLAARSAPRVTNDLSLFAEALEAGDAQALAVVRAALLEVDLG